MIADRVNDATESLFNLCDNRHNSLVVDHGEHRAGVRDGDNHIPLGRLLHDDVAGQEKADLRFVRERLMREFGIASAKDYVAPEIDIELLLQRRLDVDLCEDAEALAFQGGGHSLDRLIEGGIGES